MYEYWLATAPLVAIAAGHLILAGVVTAHVLLHKADTKSAFGWIGVAWLSPIFGAALYWAFGINRVSRRATRLRRRRARQGERRSRQAKMGLPAQGPRQVEIEAGRDSAPTAGQITEPTPDPIREPFPVGMGMNPPSCPSACPHISRRLPRLPRSPARHR